MKLSTKESFQQLFVDNPMLIEITRFRRRFLSFSGSTAVNAGYLGLGVLLFAGLLMVVINFRGDIDPMALVTLQTVLCTLLIPSLLHGAIAGERERRSWDLLLVAPVTKAQIVAGKFVGALAAIAVVYALFAIPMAIAAITFRSTHPYNLLLAELLSFAFCMAVAGWTLLMSARVKRPMMALGASLGSLVVALVVIPSLISVLLVGVNGAESRLTMDFLFFLHPITSLMRIGEASNRFSVGAEEALMPASLFGIPQILIYVLLTAVFLAWAEKTLSFADNDVKFLPKARDENA